MIALTLSEIAEATGGVALGVDVVVDGAASLDSRALEPGGLFVAIAGEQVDGHDFVSQALANGAAAVIASRPVDAPTVLVPDVTVALGRLARHLLDQIDGITVIALTGSSGKTSTKDLLVSVLEPEGVVVATIANLNNELGVPLTVLRADELTRYLVVEMGARGIGHIAELCEIAPPDVGLVLNVGHAHVGEFGSAEAIAQAKGELAEAVGDDGVVVLNADDPMVGPMSDRTQAAVLTFGAKGDLAIGDVTLDSSGTPHFTLTHAGQTVDAHVPQIGAYQASNAAAAVAAAIAAGVDFRTAAARLATARPRTAMRMERHDRADGLVVINDAYNANPESMAAALRALVGMGTTHTVAVLGEMRELGDESVSAHRAIGQLARELGISRVIVVGDEAVEIAVGAGDIAHTVPDVDAAIADLSASLSGDEVVLVKASRGARLERVVQGLLDD